MLVWKQVQSGLQFDGVTIGLPRGGTATLRLPLRGLQVNNAALFGCGPAPIHTRRPFIYRLPFSKRLPNEWLISVITRLLITNDFRDVRPHCEDGQQALLKHCDRCRWIKVQCREVPSLHPQCLVKVPPFLTSRLQFPSFLQFRARLEKFSQTPRNLHSNRSVRIQSEYTNKSGYDKVLLLIKYIINTRNKSLIISYWDLKLTK
jgi:hypothetical protein